MNVDLSERLTEMRRLAVKDHRTIRDLEAEVERLRSALQDIDNDFGAGNSGGLSDFIHAVLKLGA